MRLIECPEITYDPSSRSVFLGGGISPIEGQTMPDWQAELSNLLKDQDLSLYNPRRKNFNIKDPNATRLQIEWEEKYIRISTAVSFWFPKEGLCSITLFELGKVLMMEKDLFIGIHPEYVRKEDVEIQTKLVSDTNIVYSLEDLSTQIKIWNDKTDLNSL